MKPCVQAPGARNSKGYARVSVGGVVLYAHRAAYAAENGSIPPGITVDHTCHNVDLSCRGGRICLHRGCIEPTHLDGVSSGVNTLRGGAVTAEYSRATHCVHDHELTPENVYSRPGRPTHRGCRQCMYARTKRSNTRRREQLRANPDLAGVVHGRTSTYTNLGCRCVPCGVAGRSAAAEYRRRRDKARSQA